MLFRPISSANVIRFPCRGSTILFSPRSSTMMMMMMMPHFASSSSYASATHKKQPKPWLLVGLGNPGEMYQGTRHNVGFEMLDAFAEDERISMSSVSFKALFGKGRIGNVPVMLAKPQTTMNASGESVDSIVSYYKIPLEQVVVIYDDYDLPLATLRVKQKGGHGGHNGMRSIIDHFKGFCNFPRLRIGIGSPPGDMLIGDFVLGRFDRKEREELDLSFQDGVEALRILVLMGFDRSAHFTNTSKSRKWQRWVHLTKLHTLIANTKSRAGRISLTPRVGPITRANHVIGNLAESFRDPIF